MTLDWKNAIVQLEKLKKTAFEHIGFSMLQLSCAHFMDGNYDKAIAELKEIPNLTVKVIT
jgi:outer membrane protein assembly factor BamD (BamD/ComL family)